MTDISWFTAAELVARYGRRSISPVEVTHRILARIERLEPALNAFVLVGAEAALNDARASEARWFRGEPLGPLDGVPISIKDLLDVQGWPTRRGSLTTASDGPAVADAPVVARLREAGAVLLGKTTTTEFGLSGSSSSPLTGVTRNPWLTTHSPGGSSAGGVAAVAAGLGPIAIGTDGGGSIRVPSAYTGVFGLKPTLGRVATSPPDVVGLPAHIGPIARCVADLATALGAIARPDIRDPYRPPLTDEITRPSPLASLRIAYSATLGYAQLDPDVASAFERAVAAFRELGARLEAAEPDFAPPADVRRTLYAARAAFTVRNLGPDQRAQLDPVIARAASEGEALSARDLVAADAARVMLAQHMARFHARFDLLLTPTTALAAPAVDEPPGSGPERAPFAYPFSLTRQPALSVPCGLTRTGLPIGLQIVGRHFDEASVLAAALAFERIVPFVPPPLAGAAER